LCQAKSLSRSPLQLCLSTCETHLESWVIKWVVTNLTILTGVCDEIRDNSLDRLPLSIGALSDFNWRWAFLLELGFHRSKVSKLHLILDDEIPHTDICLAFTHSDDKKSRCGLVWVFEISCLGNIEKISENYKSCKHSTSSLSIFPLRIKIFCGNTNW